MSIYPKDYYFRVQIIHWNAKWPNYNRFFMYGPFDVLTVVWKISLVYKSKIIFILYLLLNKIVYNYYSKFTDRKYSFFAGCSKKYIRRE